MAETVRRELTSIRLYAVGGAASLVPLNSTMIAVALPRIADDFDISVGRTSVLVTVYLVMMLVGQPLAGRLADRFGTTRTVEVSLLGFAAASMAAAIAPGFELLVLGRVGQAVFGAALVPGAQAIVRTAASAEDRGRLFGLLGSMLGVGAAGGPIIGGAVIELFGWRAMFVLNLPIVLFALLVRLPTGSGLDADADAAGSVVSSSLVRNRPFVVAFAVQALSTLGQYMLLLVAPIILDARGWSPSAIGVALTGLTVGMIVMGPIGGRVGDRRGRRQPVVIGLAVCTAALVLAAAGGRSIAPPQLIAALTAFGFGLGFAVPSVQTAALEVVQEHRVGAAAGIQSMSRYVGSITTSLLVAAWISSDGAGARAGFAVAAGSLGVSFAIATGLPSITGGGGRRRRPDSHSGVSADVR